MLHSRVPNVRYSMTTCSMPIFAGSPTRTGTGVRISWYGTVSTSGCGGPGSATSGLLKLDEQPEATSVAATIEPLPPHSA